MNTRKAQGRKASDAPDAGETNESHSLRGWAVSLLLLAGGVVYICMFWGEAASFFPKPLSQWACFCRRTLRLWYHERLALWLAAQFCVGMVVPTVLLMLCGGGLAQVGFGWPNALGRRLIMVSIVLSIPFGVWLLNSFTQRPGRPIINLHYVCGLLVAVPEHFLICGIFLAVMLPGRALPDPAPMATVEGPFALRVLRWLGLAQPPPSENAGWILAWFGLTGSSLVAVLVSGTLFWMVHIGKGDLEALLSLPGGVAVAYVTLRSRSIWPAVLGHWAMNLIPLGLLAALG